MVDILLATYNGDKYLEEQIQSIISQTYSDWCLLIHDDGSCDNTLVIIEKYSSTDSRIILIDDKITGLGVAKNFIHLLNFSNAEFVMFCDQDDIWLDNKISIMLNAITKKDNQIPQAIFSNSYLWNDAVVIISNKNTLTYPRKLEELLFLNTGIQGAAAIFNEKTRVIMQIPLSHYAMHDHVLVLVAMVFGEIDYINVPLMYYRQHDENVTGKAPGSILNKLLLLSKHAWVTLVSENHYKGLTAFYEKHQNEIPSSKKQIIQVFLSLPKTSLRNRIILIVKYKFKLFNSTLLLLCKMCLRKYI